MIFSIIMSLSVHSNLLVLLCFQFIFELAFLKILQNWQGNTCVRASFSKEVATLLKKRPWHRYFPGIFTKILRTAFFKDYFGETALSLLLEALIFFSFPFFLNFPMFIYWSFSSLCLFFVLRIEWLRSYKYILTLT